MAMLYPTMLNMKRSYHSEIDPHDSTHDCDSEFEYSEVIDGEASTAQAGLTKHEVILVDNKDEGFPGMMICSDNKNPLENIPSVTAITGQDGRGPLDVHKNERASTTLPSVIKSTKPRYLQLHEKRHQCNWKGCNARLARVGDLKNHKLTHTAKKPFICDWPGCNKRFSKKSSIAPHKVIHTGERPYICKFPQCLKRFSYSSSVKIHEKLHTDPNRYVCDWKGCGKHFSRTDSLKSHKRTHTGEKPYICDWPHCGRGFSQGYNLASHKLIHTGEWPYVCEKCGKGFSRRSHLLRHQKKHNIGI